MSDAQSSTQSIGRYRIVRPLGSGAMGDVYLARDPHIDRELAIKTVRVLDGGAEDIEERTQRLLREARAAGKLLHPHVVTLFDADEVDGMLYLAFEYVPGTDLAQRARRAPPLSLREVLRTVREVASALDYAHGRNIVHRDIKPSNLLIGTDGEAKVADFGIAKLKDQSTELTRTGSVVGSPQYMSPEQVRGEDLDGRSDIFSLGVVLYEMLCRIRPFSGDTISTLVFQILAEEPTPIDRRRPGLEPRLASLVHRMLAKNREERVASGAEVVRSVRELERVLSNEVLDAPAALGPDQMPTQRIRSSGSVTPPSAEAFLGASAAGATAATSVPPPVPVPGATAATASQIAPTATLTSPPTSATPTAPPGPPPAAPPAGAPSMSSPPPATPPPGWDGSTLTPRAGAADAKRGGGKILWIVAGLLLLLLAAGAGGWLLSVLTGDDAAPAEEVAEAVGSEAVGSEAVGSEAVVSEAVGSEAETEGDAPGSAVAPDGASNEAPGAAQPADEPAPSPPAPEPSPSEPLRRDASRDPPPRDPPPRDPPPRDPPPRAASSRDSSPRDQSPDRPTRAEPTPDPGSSAPRSAPPATTPVPPSAPSVRPADRLVDAPTPREQLAERRDARREERRTRLEERFDSDAASARQVLETGRSFRFDVEPDDTIVKFRRRGERSIVQGTVDEFEVDKRKKSDLELPGDGEFLIYLVREGYPDAIYHVKVDSSRPGPTVIRQRMGGAS